MRLDNLVFITFIDDGFEEKWSILKDDLGNPIEVDEWIDHSWGGKSANIHSAIKFVRGGIGKTNTIGLACFKQMQMNNAQWDNI